MKIAHEEYTKHYIVQALFKLMSILSYDKISVTDIAKKAGVGRATFYRYFKRKEDVIVYYFELNTKEFIFGQHFYPRYKEDHIKTVKAVLTRFKENKEPFSLLKKACLEYIYLNYLNKNFIKTFKREYPNNHSYAPYLYAGMLFNVSMAWLDNDCKEDINALAELIVSAIYFE